MPKKCSRCGERKALRAFYKQARGAHGRRGACKECYRAAQRAAYAKDLDVQAARRRQVEKWRDEGLSV
jgi:hypothetical protein